MMKNKERLYLPAAIACRNVYERNTDLGTTEYHQDTIKHNGVWYKRLTFAGTNEGLDWIKNFKLWSWEGIKLSAYRAAGEVHYHLAQLGLLEDNMIIQGHSKGAIEAIAYMRRFSGVACFAFSPPPGLRPWADLHMDNTVLFLDPDDPVPDMGRLSFRHPECQIVRAPDDHFWPNIGDHGMDSWIDFLLKEKRW